MKIPHATIGSYSPRAGNAVRPLVDGVAAFRRIAEAIEAANHSVWVTVAFIAPDFRMRDGQDSLFDVLDRTVARGLDVRVIFWRPNPECAWGAAGWTFPGSQTDRNVLNGRGSRFRARWDRAHGPYAQHQKSWLVDAGQPSEIAFLGGMNLTGRAVGSTGHDDGGHHDVYVEISGPAATDVHHNFVQRWNEASERQADDGRWGHEANDQLPFPTRLSVPRGLSLVQIQRNIHSERYTDGRASPDFVPYNIYAGERTIFDQYLIAINASREAIYIENQAIPIPPIAATLEHALRRGVDVVVLVPAEPQDHIRAARRNRDRQLLFDQVARLGTYEHFSLVGIGARNVDGGRSNIYVHSKIMLIDDAWATIGSCNLHSNSLFGHSEMNASIWDDAIVRDLRCALLSEHLGQDTGHLDARAALRLYRDIAERNRRRRDAGDSNWQGLACRLDPACYGE
jgi:cardiolipin synthase